MLAAFSPGSDFKRYYRGRMPRLALAVIILMPLMYGALYLWAFWNPFNEVDKMPIALVNMDAGATLEGKPLAAGEQVVQGLVESKQLDLHVVSESEAADGVAHGKYYFSITLPKDFSEAVVSPTTGNARSAPLIFTYDDANNYLASVLGGDAAQQVVAQVSSQVGTQTFDIAFKEVGSMLPQVTKAVDGANELATGLDTANSGAHELSGALDELSGVVTKVTDPLLAATSASGGLSPAEVKAAAVRVGEGATAINEIVGGAATTQSRGYTALDSAITGMASSPDPAMRALARSLTPARDALANRGLGPDANNTATALLHDSQMLSAAMTTPGSQVHSLLALAETGGLHSDIEKARGDATELSSGADQLAAGTTKLAAGAHELAGGLDEASKAIPHWNKKQQDALAKTLSQPVVLSEKYENEAGTFGTGFAPFFFSLALFVGGIIAWMLFTPLQSRPIAQGLNSVRAVLASYAPTFGVGVLQAAILFAVTVLAVGLRPAHVIGTFLFMLLVVAAFLSLIQMFNALFGPAVGRVVTLAFLMIQLTSAGGIYPVETTTKPFQYIHWIDPMTYTVNGLRQMIMGGVDYRFWVAFAVLSGLTVVFLSISVLAARRNRQYTMDRLYPPVEV
ncbi:YhgE/Pip domain-containing protein [Gordonia sp. HY285]|uniref:YhgE/Pip domain-containing protein n=1 Tax=Gordonia liuliyuniae TaxID=2911517 RepID=UPI001F1F5B03|nr:YhgE/Pip domain-containing protein [Gordonia liuliyuniae]MCF8609477.1 YhgE/Pip domain-containing protein [Gordonia liuliyuniae]